MGRTEARCEPTQVVGASLGSCATTAELQTDGCVLRHKPISNSTISCIFRLRLYLLLVYVADDDGDIFNTLLAQVTLKRAEKAPKRSQRLGCSCRGLSCPWGRGEQAQPRSRPGRALPL